MSHAFFIRGFDGPKSYVEITFDGTGCRDVHRIEARVFFQENLVTIQNLLFFRFLHKTGPIIRVGNVNEGLRPLPYGATLQIGNAVFSDNCTYGFQCTEPIGQMGNG